ncbi:pyrimidine 5'-nucleotidase [Methylobrevis albus]|uniref:Pyrimidine 5'-nucleotidase n=1 Tax=Methylobrevis albus TaxID=2793297 RepID=A0A931HZ93_9HYPH|nr:pyrimidine 5'-nucleotidase [Methylobrevis albus]MBH0237482.1 pyrimidine 5'-nucleotidase [Methylobrevis albus]
MPFRPREGSHAHLHDLRIFRGTEAWVFDLDNTLYPAHSNLFGQVDVRIRDYLAKLLDLAPEAANAVQKDYYRRYGTTLRGLMEERGVCPDDFLEYVHDIDHSVIEPDPALGTALAALPGKKYIFTNGSRRHAEKTVERLGIAGHFSDTFDIVAADLLPKPNRETYDRFLAATGVAPARAAMFEDLSRNLVVPHALGMHTVLIVPTGTREVFREAWELEGDVAPHVEFTTDDLAGFVAAVTAAIAD